MLANLFVSTTMTTAASARRTGSPRSRSVPKLVVRQHSPRAGHRFARDMTLEQGKPAAEAKMEALQTADTFE